MRTYATLLAAALNVIACQGGRGTVIIGDLEDTGPQTTDTGGLTLDTSTPAETDTPPEPWVLTGDLTIENSRDLEGLAGLEVVNGDLTIRNVSDIGTLRDLRQVSGRLVVEYTRLRDLDDLQSLRDVRALRLRSNEDMVSVSGLSDVISMTTLEVIDNDALPALTLGVPRSMGAVSLSDNEVLSDLASLEAVDAIDEVYVVDNPSLCQTYAFATLSDVAQDFYVIEDNEGSCP